MVSHGLHGPRAGGAIPRHVTEAEPMRLDHIANQVAALIDEEIGHQRRHGPAAPGYRQLLDKVRHLGLALDGCDGTNRNLDHEARMAAVQVAAVAIRLIAEGDPRAPGYTPL